jgi:OmpA-OmpF porin, OOP family
VAYERQEYGELSIPLTPLQVVVGKRNAQNNKVFEPQNKKALEGQYTRIAYVLPANRSPLEVLRNYQDEIKSQRGKTLFECRGAECGGSAVRNWGGGGGEMSLAM